MTEDKNQNHENKENKEGGEDQKKNLEELLKECEKQKAEYLAGWQRERADFINYKKEEMERIEGFLRYAKEEFLLQLLNFLDIFDLAEKNLPEDLKKNEYVKGLLQVGVKIREFLKNQGVEEIKTEGEKFDPRWHEAVEEVEDKNVESGMIVEEIQKGYTINSKLLRPAKVRVAK